MKTRIMALYKIVIFVFIFGLVTQAQTRLNVGGGWILTYQGSNGMVIDTLKLIQHDTKITGTMTFEDGTEVPLENGTLTGKDLSFSVTQPGESGKVRVEYKGTIEGETAVGTFQEGHKSVKWTAKHNLYSEG
jgi:hypothetical protein